MAGKPNYKHGDTVGPWLIISDLGAGGNAEVYEAERADSFREKVALKVISDKKGEKLQRFQNEVRILRRLGNREGIVPLIAASLSDSEPLTGTPPHWSAMPIATPIRLALNEDRSLEKIVEATIAIATTLAQLEEERYFHRDIKPENLYSLNGQWVISDFGLVKYPDSTLHHNQPITENNRPPGPRYLLPPEVERNATDPDIDWGRVQVWMLAVTLWLLATGDIIPYPGTLRVGDLVTSLAKHWPDHPRARMLDYVIERATSLDPTRRQTMWELRDDLHAWGGADARSQRRADLSDLVSRIATLRTPLQSYQQARLSRTEDSSTLLERWWKPLESSLINTLNQVDLHPHQRGFNSSDTTKLLDIFHHYQAFGEPNIIWSGGKGLRVIEQIPPPHSEEYPVSLWAGVGVELFEDGVVHLIAGYITQGWVNQHVIWSRTLYAKLGSSEMYMAVSALNTGMEENIRPAIESFIAFVQWAISKQDIPYPGYITMREEPPGPRRRLYAGEIEEK